MNNRQIIIETSINLLRKLAMVAGFASQSGLYNGRMGIIIVLYSGASIFALKDVEEIADNLLDDLLYEIQQNTYSGFSNGIFGVGWGIDYLIKNKYIEADPDFFNDIDNLIISQSSVNELGLEEYILSGLYLSSRLINNKNSGKLKNCANEYVTKTLGIISQAKEESLIYNDSFLPFWYSLGEIDFMKISKFDTAKRLINDYKSKEKMRIFFEERYSILEMDNMSILSFKTINQYFFDRLFYGAVVPKLPTTLLDESFNALLYDEKLIKSIEQTLNPLNLGLCQSFSGFVWSTLQYCRKIVLF